MASASYTLDKLDNTTTVFTLAGSTGRGAEYKLTSRALSLPLTLKIDFQVGATGSKGNDHLIVTIANTVQDSSGVIGTGSVKIDVSVPRNSGWTGTDTDDLLAYVQSFLSDARLASIADALVP